MKQCGVKFKESPGTIYSIKPQAYTPDWQAEVALEIGLLASQEQWTLGKLTCTVQSSPSSFPAKITRNWSAGTPCRLATASFSWKILVSESTSTGKPWLELNLTNTEPRKLQKRQERNRALLKACKW